MDRQVLATSTSVKTVELDFVNYRSFYFCKSKESTEAICSHIQQALMGYKSVAKPSPT